MSGENEDTRILFHSRIQIPRELQLLHIGSSSIAKTLTTIYSSCEATMRGRFCKEFQHTGLANLSKIQSSNWRYVVGQQEFGRGSEMKALVLWNQKRQLLASREHDRVRRTKSDDDVDEQSIFRRAPSRNFTQDQAFFPMILWLCPITCPMSHGIEAFMEIAL